MRRHGPLVSLLVAIPLLALGPAEPFAPTQWALLIGIDDYVEFDAGEGGDLRGAVADARSMRDILVEHRGFPEQNVRMLLDGAATRSAIETSITEWLASAAHAGDNVTIYFAGHGSQVWDEDDDEDDGLDETLAPADVLPLSSDKDITDDVFESWLSALPTEHVTVILDASSSAGTRLPVPSSRARRLGREWRALPRPESAARRAIPGVEDESGFDVASGHVLEWTAAQPAQAAVESAFYSGDGTDAHVGGVFTTFLVRELWKAPADMPIEELAGRVAGAVKRNRFQQAPLLWGDEDARSSPVFSVEGAGAIAGASSLVVRSVAGTRAELATNRALDIVVGSVFETENGALMEVEGTDAESLTALIVKGTPREGESATLAGHPYPPAPLAVNVGGIDEEVVSVLGRALGPEAGVELVRDTDALAHLVVRRRGNETLILGPDGTIRHDAMGVTPADAADLAVTLRQEAAAKRLADLENPSPAFGVHVELEGGKTDFAIGDVVSFHVTSGEDGYLTLVDLGTDGNVVMLYPNLYDDAVPIRAGRTVSFPTQSMGFQLEIFPPAGQRTVRAFVTPAPLDIRFLGEFAMGDERFAAVIADAVRRGVGTVGEVARLDTWGTASVVYDVHP